MGMNLGDSVIRKEIELPFINELSSSYYLYIGIFVLFSFNILPQDLLMIAAIIIFIVTPLKNVPFLYIFSLPWMYVAKLSFGLTLSLVQSVIFISKIILNRKELKLSNFDNAYFFYLCICAAFNLLLFHSFTGISFVLYFLISSYFISNYFQSEENRSLFWKLSLYTVVLSCIIAVVYGHIYNTSLSRWIRGMGYATQLYGTLGTTRFGIYLCIGLLFPLYYIKNKWLKVSIIIALSIAILSTISVTAIGIMLGLFVLHFIVTGKLSGKKMILLLCIIIIMGVISYFWNNISELSLIKPIALRIDNVLYQAKIGNLDVASTGRTELFELYMDNFNGFPLINKVFGSFQLAFDGVKYSHNSYYDMLNYGGIIGVILTIILQFHRLKSHRLHNDYKMYLLLKFIIILPAATVSIYSAQFWQIWLYI